MGDGRAGGLGQALVYLSYSREAEAEADAAAMSAEDWAALKGICGG